MFDEFVVVFDVVFLYEVGDVGVFDECWVWFVYYGVGVGYVYELSYCDWNYEFLLFFC